MSENVTEREYLEALIQANKETSASEVGALRALQGEHNEAHLREHQFVQTAITKAEESLTLRLEAVHMFQTQIDRERGSYVTREQLDDRIAVQVKSLDENSKRIGAVEAQQARMYGWLAAASVGLTIAMFVIAHFWR